MFAESWRCRGTMRSPAARRRFAGAMASLVLAACAAPQLGGSGGSGDDDSSTFEQPEGDAGTFGPKADAAPGDPKELGDEQKACASTFSETDIEPVNLVFMYDESQSMTQPTGSGTSKWDAAKKGVASFTAQPASAGLSAAIEFFSGPPVGQLGPLCEAATYSASVAGPVALPDNGNVIANAIGSRTPNGSTATYYAMLGARQIATTILTQRPGERAAIVFVTDGLPEGSCDYANSIDSTAQVASQSLAAGVPVYVIGVGNALGSLNAIAKSGGTSAAYIVDTNGDVSASLLAALDKIRGHVASCSLAIPAPPDGETLDVNAVNVGYNSQTLTYSKDCSSGAGWHYDNANAPKSIELCASSCDDVKKTSNAKVTVAFGCATKGGVVK